MKKVLTEKDVLRANKDGRREILLDADGVITPAAADTARRLGIVVKREGERFARLTRPVVATAEVAATISLGSDHAGLGLKEFLRTLLAGEGFRVVDRGAFDETPVDYPDIAVQVAQDVARRRAWRGIVIDGAGIGSAIVANKLPGIRAATCASVEAARSSREHNDANILALGSRMVDQETAAQIVRVWLTTDFGGGRHERRLKKIEKIERRYLRG
ncbi:MAG: ribose 5-phosphate isomerase B [Calditrichaeota bacterium]|nr:ribose 5-phosphate isomerase B [Calditrichota bacterium]